MSAPKFTPGPWRAEEGQRVYGDATRIKSDGETLALVPPDCTIEIEGGAIAEALSVTAKANARLIAAAPDLYAVLREAVDQIDAKFTEKGEEIVAHRVQYPKLLGRARAALAKAEGSQ